MKMAITASYPTAETEVLGLEPGETTPVRIILAAQLRLRRFRQGKVLGSGLQTGSEIRQIVAARDSLLRRSVGVIAHGEDHPHDGSSGG